MLHSLSKLGDSMASYSRVEKAGIFNNLDLNLFQCIPQPVNFQRLNMEGLV